MGCREESLKPAHELGVGDAQFGVGQFGLVGQRQGEPLQFVAQVGGENGVQLTDDVGVNGSQAIEARGIQGFGCGFRRGVVWSWSRSA